MVKRYPAIELIARHGRRIATGLGVVAVATALGAFFLGGTWERLGAGLVGAALVFGFARVGAELVEVIAETLLPR